MGKDAQVYLGSAELAAVCSLLGRIPTVQEYNDIVSKRIDPFASDLYRYLNFDQIAGFENEGRVIALEDMPRIEDILGIPDGVLSK
jgi:aconitate hydratase 2/2-methylisocitrate dehydratase